jgi:hypothetical protein
MASELLAAALLLALASPAPAAAPAADAAHAPEFLERLGVKLYWGRMGEPSELYPDAPIENKKNHKLWVLSGGDGGLSEAVWKGNAVGAAAGGKLHAPVALFGPRVKTLVRFLPGKLVKPVEPPCPTPEGFKPLEGFAAEVPGLSGVVVAATLAQAAAPTPGGKGPRCLVVQRLYWKGKGAACVLLHEQRANREPPACQDEKALPKWVLSVSGFLGVLEAGQAPLLQRVFLFEHDGRYSDTFCREVVTGPDFAPVLTRDHSTQWDGGE